MTGSPKILSPRTVRQSLHFARHIFADDLQGLYVRAGSDAVLTFTLLTPGHEYESLVADPTNVVLVAEDVLDPEESGKVYDALRKSPLHRPGLIPEARVVVGVCSIALRPGSLLIEPIQAIHDRCKRASSFKFVSPLLLTSSKPMQLLLKYGLYFASPTEISVMRLSSFTEKQLHRPRTGIDSPALGHTWN